MKDLLSKMSIDKRYLKIYLNFINARTELLLQIGIVVMTLVLLACGICVVAFTVKNWKNSNRLIEAQVEVYNAQRDNIGKPQIIEQRYFSPQN